MYICDSRKFSFHSSNALICNICEYHGVCNFSTGWPKIMCAVLEVIWEIGVLRPIFPSICGQFSNQGKFWITLHLQTFPWFWKMNTNSKPLSHLFQVYRSPCCCNNVKADTNLSLVIILFQSWGLWVLILHTNVLSPLKQSYLLAHQQIIYNHNTKVDINLSWSGHVPPQGAMIGNLLKWEEEGGASRSKVNIQWQVVD